jgi:hypothetical protein
LEHGDGEGEIVAENAGVDQTPCRQEGKADSDCHALKRDE